MNEQYVSGMAGARLVVEAGLREFERYRPGGTRREMVRMILEGVIGGKLLSDLIKIVAEYLVFITHRDVIGIEKLIRNEELPLDLVKWGQNLTVVAIDLDLLSIYRYMIRGSVHRGLRTEGDHVEGFNDFRKLDFLPDLFLRPHERGFLQFVANLICYSGHGASAEWLSPELVRNVDMDIGALYMAAGTGPVKLIERHSARGDRGHALALALSALRGKRDNTVLIYLTSFLHAAEATGRFNFHLGAI